MTFARPGIVDTNRAMSLLGKPPFVHNEHGVAITRVAENEVPNIVPDTVRAPMSGTQQALHAVRVLLSPLRGELPTVAPPYRIKNSPQIDQRTFPRLGPRKSVRYVSM